MEKLFFTRACLSDVSVIKVIMRVPLVKLLCQAAKSMRYWKLLDRATGCPGPSWVGEGGGSGRQVAKSYLLTSTIMRKRDGTDCSRIQFFLGWWPLFLSQELWGYIRYEVYGSPVVCYWREEVVSRSFGRNRWPTVPGVLDPDRVIRFLTILFETLEMRKYLQHLHDLGNHHSDVAHFKMKDSV
jgi:hypothetical protein